MCGQQDIDPVVHVEPFRMVVGLFGQDGDARHETEGFGKIRKTQTAPDAQGFGIIAPVRQLAQGQCACGVVKLLNGHV